MSQYGKPGAERTEHAHDVEDVRERIGEDPARFLDRNLYHHGVRRVAEKDSYGPHEASHTPVRDSHVSTPGEMVRDRIQGIDSFHTVQVWIEVEKSLERTPDGGRDEVISLLRDRIAELEEHGERPDDETLQTIAADVREDNPEWDETDDVDLPPWAARVGIPSWDRSEPATTDGGEER